MARVHVVVVDDEVRMVELVSSYLTEAGFTTTTCHDGVEGLRAATAPRTDVVVLDLNLPGMSGLEVCRALRARGDDVPVLMLTARGSVAERVAGFEAGADDYVVKPFALEELAARVRALGRRRESAEVRRLVAGDVVLDLDQQRVWVGDEETPVTRREFALLGELMAVPGHVVSRQRLFDALWDGETDIRSNALEVHVSRLRARLEGSREVVVTTIRGSGYRLETRGPGDVGPPGDAADPAPR